MDNQEKVIRKHFLDLYRKSWQSSIYSFTDFLSLADISVLTELIQSGEILDSFVTLDGGLCGAERQVARFGSPEEFGWEEEFPIKIIKVSPLLQKFGENLSHRDYLGALMNLGIERSTIGDIRIRDKDAWIAVMDHMADYIMDNLDQVRHTHVKCSETTEEEETAEVQFEELSFTVSSARIDAVVSKLVNESRGKVLDRFREKKIFVNGRVQENNSAVLKNGDVLSVRGFGKYIYDGADHTTKKGNLHVIVRRYI